MLVICTHWKGQNKLQTCRAWSSHVTVFDTQSSPTTSIPIQTTDKMVAVTHDPLLCVSGKSCELLVERLTVAHEVTSFLEETSTHSVDDEPIKVNDPNKDTCTPTLSTKTKQKKVQFEVDDNDKIQAAVHVLPKNHEGYCKDELYWSRPDLKHMAQRSRKVGKWLASEHSDLVHSLHLMYSVPDASTPEMTLNDALRTFYESAGRGLERHVAPRIGEHRRWAIRTVISVQARLKQEQLNEECQDLSDEDVERLLSQRAATVSRRSQDFAQYIGSGDAAEADLVYSEYA